MWNEGYVNILCIVALQDISSYNLVRTIVNQGIKQCSAIYAITRSVDRRRYAIQVHSATLSA